MNVTVSFVCIRTDGFEVLDGYKDTYFVGERIDMTTLVVRINYAGGQSLDMMLLESMVSYDFSKPGKATVTVEYDGMRAEFEVTVLEAPETAAPETTEAETALPETEASAPETEASAPETTQGPDVDVPEPAIDNEGCGAVLMPAALILLGLAALALGRKEN